MITIIKEKSSGGEEKDVKSLNLKDNFKNITGSFITKTKSNLLLGKKKIIKKKIDKILDKKSKKDENLEDKIVVNQKSIDAKVSNDERNYILRFLDKQQKMLDYSKLFSYMGTKRESENQYVSYNGAYSDDAVKELSEIYTVETISKDAIDRVIEDKKMSDLFGFNAGRADYKEQEAFKFYKIFNNALVEMRYSAGS